MSDRFALLRVLVLLPLLLLVACGESPAPAPVAAPKATKSEGGKRNAPVPVEQLMTEADAAQKEGRVFDPAEDNAFERYLEVAQREEDDDGRPKRLTESVAATTPQQQARYQLNELLVPGLKWVEQALAAGELADAQRVLAMLEGAHPGTHSVQRLRTRYDGAIAKARAELRTTEPDRLPMLMSQRPPVYPARAKRQGTEGWVHLGFTIQPDGTVNEVKVLASEPPDVFEREAVKALSQWKFDAPPSPVRGQQRFDFRIDPDDE